MGHFLCPVEKRYAVKQCFKCQGFGHVLKDCKSVSPTCFRCASHDHYGRDCDKRSREFRKCSNCAESSNPLFQSGCTSHNAASIDCPVLLQHVKFLCAGGVAHAPHLYSSSGVKIYFIAFRMNSEYL